MDILIIVRARSKWFASRRARKVLKWIEKQGHMEWGRVEKSPEPIDMGDVRKYLRQSEKVKLRNLKKLMEHAQKMIDVNMIPYASRYWDQLVDQMCNEVCYFHQKIFVAHPVHWATGKQDENDEEIMVRDKWRSWTYRPIKHWDDFLLFYEYCEPLVNYQVKCTIHY